MIEEVARVIEINADKAMLEVVKTSSCNSCNAKGACGTASLSQVFNFRAPALEVDNTLGAKSGDQVVVALPERSFLAGSFLLYILPLISMILAAAFVGWINGPQITANNASELPQIVAGLLGLIGGLLLTRKLSDSLFEGSGRARLLRIVSSPQPSVTHAVELNHIR